MPPRPGPAWRACSLGLGMVLGAALLAACSSRAGPPPPPPPGPTAQAYTTAWQAGNWAAMGRLTARPPSDFQAVNAAELSDLGVHAGSFSLGAIQQLGARATAAVTQRFEVPSLGPLTVHSSLHLVRHGRHWKVVWTPQTVDPLFGGGGHFAVSYQWPPRAPILAADGSVLSSQQIGAVEIGVEGSFITNPTTLAQALVTAGAPPSAVNSALAAARANPTTFEPVFQVSAARYEQLKPTLYPLPGTVFRATGSGTAPPADLAAVVGSLGTITKAQLKQLGSPYSSSSIVGEGGIEQAQQRTLAGTPGGSVTVVKPSGRVLATVLHVAPKPGTPARTSIEPSVEQAAVNALGSIGNLQAALVAIKASTGQVIAVANTANLGSADLALNGQQPPGSTFKVITSTALIEHGLTPASPATCPPVINVDGENIHNASPTDAANSMLQAFTISCNTAFIGLTMANLDDSSLHKAASLYGIGSSPRLGAVAFGGSVPVATGPTDLAASAIGQSRVVLNPLMLATVAAAVDTGTVRKPRLVVGAPDDHAGTHKVPANVVLDLHEMMLSVVQSGTASGTGLPPGTYAKTGTAQYGTGPKLPIDAWLMGFNADVAFAMVVINSPAEGGPEDGPVIASFLNALGPAK